MKYMLLVCWDAERMNAQVEPDPTDAPEEPEGITVEAACEVLMEVLRRTSLDVAPSPSRANRCGPHPLVEDAGRVVPPSR